MAIKNKLISIVGAPSSGKTTLAINLAKELSEYKENILIIFADEICPVIPYIYNKKETGSIGKVLAASILDKEEILSNLVITEDNKRVLALGYAYAENQFMYPKFYEEQIEDLFSYLKTMFDWIIVDSQSSLFSSAISLQGLRSADVVIHVSEKSAKSLSFITSLSDLIEKEKSFHAKYVKVTNAVKMMQNEGAYDDYIVHNDYVFPYVKRIEDTYYSLDLLKKFKDKPFRRYQKELDRMIKDVIIDETDD